MLAHFKVNCSINSKIVSSSSTRKAPSRSAMQCSRLLVKELFIS